MIYGKIIKYVTSLKIDFASAEKIITQLCFGHRSCNNCRIIFTPFFGPESQSFTKSNNGLFKKQWLGENRSGICSFCTSTESDDPMIGRYEYHESVECAINKQICVEFEAAFAYLSVSCHFARNDVALPGCSKFFLRMFEEEMNHGLLFISFQNMRGGVVSLHPINIPQNTDWASIQQTLEVSLKMEQLVYTKILEIINCAKKHNDECTRLMFTKHLQEQCESIKEFASLVTRARKLGTEGVPDLLLDEELSKSTGHGAGKKRLFETTLLCTK